MTAKEAIKYLLDKVEPEEPVFILRGRDQLAPNVVMLWAQLADANNVNDEKVARALEVAMAMNAYPVKRLPD